MATVFLNTQIGAVEIKIPDTRILILVNTAVLNIKIDEAENKLFKVIVLCKKTYYDAQISDIQKKHLLLLIITNLRVICLIQRSDKKRISSQI